MRAPRPKYYGIVRELAQRAELPMPRVYVMNNPQPNAFATGRNPQNAAVCASTGLLETLSREEVAGVMAHELAHVKNHDTLTMTVAATIGGAISMLAQYLQFGALFGGNRDNHSGIGWIGALRRHASSRRSRPCWCRWRSAARASIRPTAWARMICGQPDVARLGAAQDRGLRAPDPQRARPRQRRRPRTCSSSTR